MSKFLRPRLLRVAVAPFMALALPAVVLATTLFGDVPPSNIFYTDITNVANAGIAAGCGGGNYCPDANVTRGQMAAFLDRAGGRIGFSGYTAAASALTGTPQVIATVTIKPGNVTGGTAFVHLQATGLAYTQSATGLPSYAVFYVRQQGIDSALANAFGYAQVDALAESSFGVANGSVNVVVSAPTGTTATYELVGYIAYGTGTLYAQGSLTAEYFPFSENGDNVLNTPASAAKTPSQLLGK